MKNNTPGFKLIAGAFVAASIGLAALSCNKSGTISTTGSTNVTETDAAQFAANAISPSSGGMVTQLSSSASFSSEPSLLCGVEQNTTVTISSLNGAMPSYNYVLNWDYILNCNADVPSNITLNFTGKGTYSGVYMSASDTSNAQFVLTPGSASAYTATVNYTRTGNATSKFGKQYTFHSVLNIQSSNIAIDKTTKEITSGTATITLVATASTGKTFNFNGTLTFLGNKKASMLLNSGAAYTIQWL